MKLTRDEFERWWNSPAGEVFKEMLKEDLTKLAYGNMTESLARDHIRNAIEVGRYQRTMEIHNLTYEDLSGEE